MWYSPRLRLNLRRGLCGIAAISAFLLLIRAIAGPFNGIVSIHSPLNLECAIALAVLLWLATGPAAPQSVRAVPRASVWPVLVVAGAAGLAYLPILSMPLVTDDYIHLTQASRGDAPTLLACLTQSKCGGPQYFRPLGFSIYAAEWAAWGTAAGPRHALDLVLHVAVSVLFLLLARRLGVPPPLDWLAGLLFALNGIGPEAVAWTAARFDTLAVLLSLVAALAVLRGGRAGLAICVVATGAACLSKESAFVLPVLLAMLAGLSLPVLSSFAVTLAVFVWRWVVLQGIGGYVEQTGAPLAFQWDGVKLAKTFLSRVWGVLWFPVNWSRPLEWWMVLALAAGVVASIFLLRSRPDRTRVWWCAAGVLVACVPAHHLLLIGPSLERSRYLIYAVPAFVLLLAAGCAGLPRAMGMATLALFVAFHLGALEHNLRIWRSVAGARYDLCRSVADRARGSAGVLKIGSLPLTVDGVYWRNGLEDCLTLEFGIPPGKVRVDDAH